MIGRGQEAGAFKSRPAEEVNFLSQYSSYFSRLKELGEEGPAHGLFFSVFLSSPGKMFCTYHFIMVCKSEFSVKRFQCSHRSGSSLLAEHIPTPHPLRKNLWLSR